MRRVDIVTKLKQWIKISARHLPLFSALKQKTGSENYRFPRQSDRVIRNYILLFPALLLRSITRKLQ